MISTIRLQNFRSYADAAFVFGPAVNIIVGPNASGKTNLLEAVLVACRGDSYRARDTDLIAFGAPWARLDSRLDDDEVRIVKLVAGQKPEKVYDISGRIFRRLTLVHSLPVVLFEPSHLALLSGFPERRRGYLDDLLAQIEPGYAATVRAYRRALAQRNRLLKTPHATSDQFFPWNVRLSELGARMARSRVGLVATINEAIGALYEALSYTTTAVRLSYGADDQAQYESHMLRQLETRLADDRLRGFTSFGPHREDFAVLFDGHPAADVASRGEVRTVVLGLKIIELRIIESARKMRPLLLLDDVFSELDATRRHALTQYLQAYQTFITTTDADIVAQEFASRTTTVIASAA